MAAHLRYAPELEISVDTVERGLSLAALNQFMAMSGLRPADIHQVVLPARTLKHRKARNEALSIDESDKLVRLARIFNFAQKVWGSPEGARQWLEKPKKRYNGRTPLQMLRTEIGGRLVEEFLGQVDEGMFV